MINRRFSFFPWAADDGYVIIDNDLNWYHIILLTKTLRDIALLVSPFVYRKEENMRKGKGKTPTL